MTIKGVVLVLGLVGCGTTTGDSSVDGGGTGSGDGGVGEDGGAGTIDINKSGTRIKMRVLNSPDGAKVFLGSFDSERNENCSFQVASDGMIRCLPSSMTFGSYFADADCSVPAGFYYAGCTPPAYVASPAPASTCTLSPTAGPAIYARGAEIAGLYTKSGVTCTGPTVVTGYAMYTSTGAVIAPTSFQSAAVAIE